MCVEILIYADDTVLYVHHKDPEQVAAKLTFTMQKVVNWLNSSHLTLNRETPTCTSRINVNKVFSQIFMLKQKSQKMLTSLNTLDCALIKKKKAY